jgi:ATP-binding cassette, subfamily B, bacterial MsbA
MGTRLARSQAQAQIVKVFSMTSPTLSKQSAYQVLKPFIVDYLFPYWKKLLVALFFMILAAAATASFAKLLQPILDKAMIGVQQDPDTISVVVPLGLLILCSFIVRGLATYIHTIQMNKVSQHVVTDIQKSVFSHLLKQDLAFFHNNPSQHLISRIASDIYVMRAAVTESMTGFGNNFLTLVFLIGVMFYQDAKLAFISLLVFPVASVLVVVIGRRLRKISRNMQAQTAQLMGVLGQIFQAIRQVQAYGREPQEEIKAGHAISSVRDLNIKSVQVGALATPINEILMGLVVFAVIVYGGYRIASGELTPGGLISFITAFGLAYEPMKKLAKLNNTLQIGVGAAERVREMLNLKSSLPQSDAPFFLKSNSPEIVFNNVFFSYHLADKKDPIAAVQGVSFRAEAGKATALVGASGSGKSTLFNLLLRFYDVEQGSISIDGVDLRQLDLKSLRNHMALVSQDITIFDDTIAANIGYGRLDATLNEIIQAAKQAGADEFIQSTVEGYNTRVGENGVKLSGGQRQRLALARAMIRQAPILLLDEATSALDNESEQFVQSSLDHIQKGKTTLVIAHRLSTVQMADQILVLDQGRIVEQGQHHDLMRLNGLYAKMYQAGFKSQS